MRSFEAVPVERFKQPESVATSGLGSAMVLRDQDRVSQGVVFQTGNENVIETHRDTLKAKPKTAKLNSKFPSRDLSFLTNFDFDLRKDLES